MKIFKLFFFPVMLLIMVSCEKDAVAPESKLKILEITYSESSLVSTAQEIEVRISKPTPCHEVTDINKSISGNTFTYNITVESGAEVCATVIDEETVTVTFDPTSPGEYTVEFLLNGQLFETKSITVTD